MESLPLSGQHTARAFTPFLLETWSPCSHPFAILPVSAVSDAQKLATGNFLHVRAGSSEVLQTSIQCDACFANSNIRGMGQGLTHASKYPVLWRLAEKFAMRRAVKTQTKADRDGIVDTIHDRVIQMPHFFL